MNKDFLKGIITGIIAPIVACCVYVLFYREEELDYFINHLVTANNLPAIISLSLLINLLIFFMNIKTNRDNQARGILFSTILYGVVIVILKFT